MGELADLPNIGKVVEAQLHQVGITSAAELRKTGALQAWLKILEIDSSACIQRLQGLEGAVQGIPKKQLTAERKAELKEFYNWHKQK